MKVPKCIHSNNEPRPKFTGSYKKKMRVVLLYTILLFVLSVVVHKLSAVLPSSDEFVEKSNV